VDREVATRILVECLETLNEKLIAGSDNRRTDKKRQVAANMIHILLAKAGVDMTNIPEVVSGRVGLSIEQARDFGMRRLAMINHQIENEPDREIALDRRSEGLALRYIMVGGGMPVDDLPVVIRLPKERRVAPVPVPVAPVKSLRDARADILTFRQQTRISEPELAGALRLSVTLLETIIGHPERPVSIGVVRRWAEFSGRPVNEYLGLAAS